MAPTLAPDDPGPRVRRQLRIRGRVQGVGFRPFVAAEARRLGLSGSVKNAGGVVDVVVSGPSQAVTVFCQSLIDRAPAAARVDDIAVIDDRPAQPGADDGFVIDDSSGDAVAGDGHEMPLDRAPCDRCLAEIDDVSDRRFGHAFTSCVACGPRFTVALALPWDRARTTMAGFVPCLDCAREHDDDDLAQRRWHAETLACPQCGPRLSSSIAVFAAALLAGRIGALQGVGGYHLCCDASGQMGDDDDDVVERLRERKQRPSKPLAVMVRDLAAARRLADIDDDEAQALASPARPIVLLQKRADCGLSPAVSPGRLIGLMLPSSPLHHLLLQAVSGRPLVMTSGNRADEPIVVDEDAAVAALSSVAEVFLHHDRPIQQRCDDAVVRVVGGALRVLRRGRGLAPSSLPLAPRKNSSSSSSSSSAPCVLAVGGHQRSTFALSDGDRAVLSPHIGDLDSAAAVDALLASIDRHQQLYGLVPDVVACDRHPDYASSLVAHELARARGLPLVTVQHHHAHLASLLAEHRHPGPIVGVVFDGSGLGDDGTLWGGEFLVGDAAAVTRAGWLSTVRLPGGERAAREPWRSALGWLQAAGVDEVPGLDRDDLLACIPAGTRRLARQLIDRGFQAPVTSSMGRLFDAVAALCGLCGPHVGFSGEAAIALEDAMPAGDDDDDDDGARYRFGCGDEAAGADTAHLIDGRPVIRAVVEDVRAGCPAGVISTRFHRAVIAMVVDTALGLCRRFNVDTVGLGGGVFMNARLSIGVARRLRAAGVVVLEHAHVPCNDGGLALGQLAVARAQLARS